MGVPDEWPFATEPGLQAGWHIFHLRRLAEPDDILSSTRCNPDAFPVAAACAKPFGHPGVRSPSGPHIKRSE
jgi:hypothetical protein